MTVPIVRLKIRATLNNGRRSYLEPDYSGNGKLKPGFALLDGQSVKCKSFTYVLRYENSGRRTWEQVGQDPNVALAAKIRMERRLAAKASGIAVTELPSSLRKETCLKESISGYLADVAALKESKTYLAYSLTLRLFASCCVKKYLEEIDRREVLNFLGKMKADGLSPRTMYNRLVYLRTFLLAQRIPFPLSKSDWPKFTEKIATCYATDELRALLEVASLDEGDLIFVLLGTGMRDKEPQFAA